MQTTTSPLKWAGGKRWLVPYIQPIWKNYKDFRLVEPFCGGLSIAIGVKPKLALLNDINPHVINFYLWLKKGLRITTLMQNDSVSYYEYRDYFNYLIRANRHTSKKSAELFYYLNKTCFNGLCRFNKSGEFNVPFGRHGTINYKVDFLEYKEIFLNWGFTANPYSSITLKNNDFVFADPPYDVKFRNYSKDGFSWNDQIELTEWLNKHKGPIVLCNQATDRIIELYTNNGFHINFLTERINIKANGDRTPANVVIATKNIMLDFSG